MMMMMMMMMTVQCAQLCKNRNVLSGFWNSIRWANATLWIHDTVPMTVSWHCPSPVVQDSNIILTQSNWCHCKTIQRFHATHSRGHTPTHYLELNKLSTHALHICLTAAEQSAEGWRFYISMFKQPKPAVCNLLLCGKECGRVCRNLDKSADKVVDVKVSSELSSTQW